MTLGAPVFSSERRQLNRVALFAKWNNAAAIDDFLHGGTPFGQQLSTGWHIRMRFLKCWGQVGELGKLSERADEVGDEDPVAAFTLARMKLPELRRFIEWGKPVEELVRDHPGQTFATAAIRWPRTVATFSMWKTQRGMLEMVRGHGATPSPDRHAKAMSERDRKDFHFEFTTLRFQPLTEYGNRPAS